MPPADRYSWIELVYAVLLVVYTAWLFARPPNAPAALFIGVAVVVTGTLFVLLGVRGLGPNWRVGQDRRDPHATFVQSGIYGILSHPIYIGLLMVGAGISLLDDSVLRTTLLLGSTGLYVLVQSDSESDHWREQLH